MSTLRPLTFTPDRSFNRDACRSDRFTVLYAILLIGLMSVGLWLAIIKIVRAVM